MIKTFWFHMDTFARANMFQRGFMDAALFNAL